MIFHNDKATITRPTAVKENGEINYIDTLITSEMPCHLSVNTLPATNQTQSTATVLYTFKLFHMTSLGIVINPNDKITVTTQQGQVFNLRAGKSHAYPLTVQTECEDLHIV